MAKNLILANFKYEEVLMRDMTDDPSQTVHATDNSIKIIEAIWDEGGLRPTELAQRLDLAKSTIHRHLSTLEDHQYLVNEGGVYHIGLKFLNLGFHAQKRKQSSIKAERWVKELCEITNEEVDFVVEEHGRGIQIYSGNQDWDSVAHDRVGEFFYLHSTAAGKAILSELPSSRVEEIVQQWGLPKRTQNTHTSLSELREELNEIQSRGYAINDEESMEGLRAIACPIIMPNGGVCGSLSITAPSFRVSVDMLHGDMSNMLLQVKNRFERELRTQ